ncbi:MAG: DUF1350 family protein [Cyanobacteria bacterium P01_H01_bin.15]
MDWQEISGSWVLVPSQPAGMVHFVGGAFVGAAPQLSYRYLLEELAQSGFVIVATPFVNTLDHAAIARNVLSRFESIYERLLRTNWLAERYLPVYGLGHSMGCKLHLLMGSLYEVERSGNVLLAYNNYPVRQAIPLVQQLELDTAFDLEFTPTPEQTNELIATEYRVRRNLLIQFANDTIDQTDLLVEPLTTRFPGLLTSLSLPGNHLTPVGQRLPWQTGETFTPLDAMYQWVKSNLSQDLKRLNQEIQRWLQPGLMV